MKKYLLYTLVLTSLVSLRSFADLESGASGDKLYAAVDRELNQVYGQLMAQLKNAQGIGTTGAQVATSIRAAQLKWIQFRDSHCEVLALESAWGGAGGSGEFASCAANLTKSRIETLKEYINVFQNMK